jgi:hypothetical protein
VGQEACVPPWRAFGRYVTSLLTLDNHSNGLYATGHLFDEITFLQEIMRPLHRILQLLLLFYLLLLLALVAIPFRMRRLKIFLGKKNKGGPRIHADEDRRKCSWHLYKLPCAVSLVIKNRREKASHAGSFALTSQKCHIEMTHKRYVYLMSSTIWIDRYIYISYDKHIVFVHTHMKDDINSPPHLAISPKSKC